MEAQLELVLAVWWRSDLLILHKVSMRRVGLQK
jgi:hypothetical protein